MYCTCIIMCVHVHVLHHTVAIIVYVDYIASYSIYNLYTCTCLPVYMDLISV